MYLTHMTQQGDRWDLLAWRYYGDALAYEGIVAANPTIPVAGELPAGVYLLIPLLSADALAAPAADLPPWLR